MIIRLSHINEEAVLNDIAKVFPNKGVSLVKLPLRVITAGTYDDNGEELTPPVYSDETRYDINIHPKYEDEYTAIEFETLVEPESPDHTIYKRI